MKSSERLYVATIAECGNITKAAEKLYMAQPSLTQSLHRIERTYGVSFFHRSRSGLRLTDEGQLFLDAAAKIENIYGLMESELCNLTNTRTGSLKLGTTVFLGGILVPQIMRRFQDRYPNVGLDMIEYSSTQLEQLLAEKKMDIALMHRPFYKYDLEYQSLYHEEFLLAVPTPPGEAVPEKLCVKKLPVITASQMRKYSFVMMNANQRIRQVADNICTAACVEPKIIFHTSSFLTALSMVHNGFGAAFVPKSFANFYWEHQPVCYYRFPESWKAEWELVAAHRQNFTLSKDLLGLIQVLQETIAGMPEVFCV